MDLDFAGVVIPFTAVDLLNGGVGLIKTVGPIIVLALAFVVAPKIIQLIRQALGGARRA